MLSEDKIQEILSGHERRNEALIEDLARKSIDVNHVHDVEHHFWSPTHGNAVGLAHELYRSGYLVLKIAPVQGGKLWNVEGGIKRSLIQAASQDVTEELARLAARFDSTYDGWGASV